MAARTAPASDQNCQAHRTQGEQGGRLLAQGRPFVRQAAGLSVAVGWICARLNCDRLGGVARNHRAGFFERADFERVLTHLPEGVAALAEFFYWSGWRKGEALGLEWRNVDEAAGIIRNEPSTGGALGQG